MTRKFKVIAGNAAWLVSDRLVRGLIGVLVGAMIARYLGPEMFGELAYVVAFVVLVQCATSLGLDLVVASDLPQRDAPTHDILGSSLRLRLLSGVLGWIAAMATMAVLRPGDLEALRLTAFVSTILVFQPAELIDLWFQSRSQSHRAIVPRLIALALATLARIWMILSGAPLWAFGAAYLIEAFAAFFLLMLFYRRYPTEQGWRWDSSIARRILRESWPLLASGMSIALYMRLDQLLLRHFSGEIELGKYSAVIPFSQAWQFVPAAICASVTPHLVRAYVESANKFNAQVSNLFVLMFWCATVLSALVIVCSSEIVGVLLGGAYKGSENILAVHALTIVPSFLVMVQVRYLSIVRRTWLMMLQTAIGVVVSSASNLLLIPLYGALGAALSAVLASVASALFGNAFIEARCFSVLFDIRRFAWIKRGVG